MFKWEEKSKIADLSRVVTGNFCTAGVRQIRVITAGLKARLRKAAEETRRRTSSRDGWRWTHDCAWFPLTSFVW
jgi:hypothetical protein